MMSFNEKFHSLDIKKDNNIVKLVNELCAMTECDQEQAYMQLSSCDFDFETAANKILESSSNNKHPDSEWQIINRQKKFKKKLEKIEVEPSGDGFKKNESNRHGKYKNPNQKSDHFKNDDKLTNNRTQRNKKNRFAARKPKEIIDAQTPDNITAAIDSFIISDSENELRWDNVADIDGAFKESSNTSQVDGFYSEDDFGQLDDHSYRGLSTQLVSDIHQKYKSKFDTAEIERNHEPSHSSQSESQIINDFLSNQLPIFGNFSQTQPPPSIQIIPDQPVSFFRAIKPKFSNKKRHYYFGINIKKAQIADQPNVDKGRNLSDDSVLKVEETKSFHPRNQIISPNEFFINQQFPPPGIMNKDYSDILHNVLQQKRTVAMVLGNGSSNYYESLNMISMPNSNQIEQIYAMNRHAAALHSNIENGMTIQSQDGFVPQSTFYTSNNMSVPFHANRK